MYQNYCNQLQGDNKPDNMAKRLVDMSQDDIDKLTFEQAMEIDIDEMYENLAQRGKDHMLLKKVLVLEENGRQLYEEMKARGKTKSGGTLKHCIISGCLHPKSHCGLYACDAEAYILFDKLFRAVIKAYHLADKHPPPNLDYSQIKLGKELKDCDKNGDPLILSTRIRVGRSIEGFGFCSDITDEDRKAIVTEVQRALDLFKQDELGGKYHPLGNMSAEVEKQMIDDHFLFRNDDIVLGHAGGYRNWPESRGIYHNTNKNFLVWFNEEDHLRFISMQKGGDVVAVFERLARALAQIEQESNLKFAKHPDYGFLTGCPTNIGTTMRASVHIDLRELRKDKPKMNEICAKYHLQPRGSGGEASEESDIFDISNKRRMGYTEVVLVQEMIDGVNALIEEEEKLRANQGKAKK